MKAPEFVRFPNLRMRRGTPCEVRRVGATAWKPHVSSIDTVLVVKLVAADPAHWHFVFDGWEVRVLPSYLEHAGPMRDDLAEPHIGLTGTREGVTPEQFAALRGHVLALAMCSLGAFPTYHHGGCVGADRDAHRAVREVWGRLVKIVIHPASDQPANLCDWSDADELLEPAPALARNRHIVEAIEHGALYACPKGMEEELRSGTWATVRHCDRMRKGTVVFWPDGSVTGRGGM